VEPHIRGERLELLTVVRGLERLDRPARVTLMTASPYVREGIRRGVAEWRKNNWQWEFFGQMAPVRNRDLWERVDRAMQYHQVDCRTWRFDQAHALPAPTASRIPGPGPGRIVRSLGLLRSLRAWARYLVRVCNTTIKAGSPDQKQGLAGAC